MHAPHTPAQKSGFAMVTGTAALPVAQWLESPNGPTVASRIGKLWETTLLETMITAFCLYCLIQTRDIWEAGTLTEMVLHQTGLQANLMGICGGRIND